jgi:monoamine oxidase
MEKHSNPVIILGAGLSGVRAALTLTRAGQDVLILEARDRIGGRVDTRVLGELTVEMGAEWVGTHDTLMRGLCSEFGIELIDHKLDISLLYENEYFAPGAWSAGAGWEKELEKLLKEFPSLTPGNIQRLQNIDWWRFMAQHHVSVRDMNIIDLIRSTDFGEDLRFVPAYDVLYDYAVGGDGDDACTYTMKGGNRRLVDAMLSEIGYEKLILSETATHVVQENGGVVVRCAGGNEYRGRALISAIPTLSVSSIEWLPALPSAQEDANARLGYCRVLKSAVSYDEKFWKDDTFAVVTDALPQQIYHATPTQEHGGALMSYAVGDRASVLAHMSEADRMEEIEKVLEHVLAQPTPKSSASVHYYWGEDPFTGGAYPLFERGDREVLQPLLRAPHGHVYFAGEHTAKRYGFMEGAVEAGDRAAQEVLRAGTNEND